MGNWTLEGLTGGFTALNTASNIGHDFRVTYKLRYRPTMLDKFTEPPKLDWYEWVKKKDHLAGEWHEYEGNQYAVKPNSYTLQIWNRRYIQAFNTAARLPKPNHKTKGNSTLLDKAGHPVPLAKLGGRPVTDEKTQADLVRGYLKSNGGVLQIEIHDIPSITLPLGVGEHTERLLLFNVGVVGGAMRVKAEQYMHVNQATLPTTWSQVFHMNYSQTWSTRDVPKKVAPPAGLVTPMAPAMGPGEYM